MTSPTKADLLVEELERLSPEERTRISTENIQRTSAEHREFRASFDQGHCYICEHPLGSFSKTRPCLHWFLKPKGFKKNDIPAIAEKFSCFQTQTYLRWVANTEAFAKNINDLAEEGSGTKLVELTIRFRNLEWSFSCAESDYLGHQTSQHAKHPHYHFQMRLDGRSFANFSDFHLPLHEGDVLSMEARRRLPAMVKHKFPHGEGMSDVLNDETVEMLVANGTAADNEDEASLKLDTFAMAEEGKTISGDELYEIIQEAKAKGVTVASLMHKLQNANTQVFVTPGPGVVEQAIRTGRKKGA
jgi:hypothetical protein